MSKFKDKIKQADVKIDVWYQAANAFVTKWLKRLFYTVLTAIALLFLYILFFAPNDAERRAQEERQIAAMSVEERQAYDAQKELERQQREARRATERAAEDAKKRERDTSLRVVQAERIVKEHLKDPKSATFRGLYHSGKAVCGEVNSKNSFGGYTGYQPFINRGRIVVFGTDPAFVAAWNEFCATHK